MKTSNTNLLKKTSSDLEFAKKEHILFRKWPVAISGVTAHPLKISKRASLKKMRSLRPSKTLIPYFDDGHLLD